jgi:hypothetical protein
MALLLLAAACGPPQVDCALVAPVGPSPTFEPRGFLTGQRYELQVFLPFPGCGQGPAADAVRVKVLDPRSQPLASEGALLGDFAARVSFAPKVPGPHHVSVVFEPTGRLAQVEALVMADRRGAPRHELPATCAEVARTASGAWLCGSRVFRGGVELEALPPGRVVAAGDRVWVVGPSSVSLFEDPGAGALVLRGALGHGLGTAPAPALAADGTRLVAATEGRVQAFFAAADGTLRSPGSAALASPAPAGGRRQVALGDTWVTLLEERGNFSSPGSPTPTPTRLTNVLGCSFTLTPLAPPSAAGECRSLVTGQLAGLEGARLWTYALQEPSTSGLTAGVLAAVELGGGGPEGARVVARLPVPTGLPLHAPGGLESTGGTAPEGWAVPRLEAGDVVLENFGTVLSAGGFARASAAHVWVTGGGRTVVWER